MQRQDGLKQGGVLNPIPFLPIIDDIIRATEHKIRKLHIEYNDFKPPRRSECAFVDDSVIFVDKERKI